MGMVRDGAEASFIANMHQAEFEAFAKSSPRSASWLQSPYAMCVLRVLHMVAANLSDGESVQYVIEDSDEHAPAARRFFERIDRKPDLKAKLRIASYEFKGKGEASGLVAPDLVGWLWQRSYFEAGELEKGRPQEEVAPRSRIWGPAMGIMYDPKQAPPLFAVHMDRKSLIPWALSVGFQQLHRD